MAGTIFGALAGGLLGSAASHGSGGAVLGGAVLGGLLGNTISREIDCEDQPYAFNVYATGLNGESDDVMTGVTGMRTANSRLFANSAVVAKSAGTSGKRPIAAGKRTRTTAQRVVVMAVIGVSIEWRGSRVAEGVPRF